MAETKVYCGGCMTKTVDGHCTQCDWDDAAQGEAHAHLPRHYTLLNRYYIGRVLGQGGFGVTYMARDLRLGRTVAVKEYLPTDQCSRLTNRVTVQAHGGERAEQFRYGMTGFLNEAQALARLDGHPNIVSITDFSEANGTAYLVMAYIDGISLKQYLEQRGGRLPWKAAVDVMQHVMSAVREMHTHGLLHRDISPGNIMMTRQNQVKVVDFGAARYAIGEHSKSLSMILKPGYAPEEQYRTRGKQGPWTDVYAVGATLYQCITGVIPSSAPDRLADDDLRPPAELCPGLPPIIDAAIMKALAVKANDRFQSIDDFQNALIGASGDAVGAKQRVADPIEPPVALPPVAIRNEATPVLYNSTAVALATFFGTPLAGSILLGINYRRLKNPSAAWKALGAGLTVTVALILWGLYGPSGEGYQALSFGIAVGLCSASFRYAKKLQGKAVQENLETGGKRGSYWAAFGIGVLTLTFVGAVSFGASFVRRAMENSVTIGTNDRVVYTGTETKEEAEKVGDSLKTIGFFSGKGAEVELSRGGGYTTISYILTKDGAWDDPKIVDAFKKITANIKPAIEGPYPVYIELRDALHNTKVKFTLDAPASPSPLTGMTDSSAVTPVGNESISGKGSLVVSVVDPAGASISHANVLVTGKVPGSANSFSASAITGTSGKATFASLLPGTYSYEVSELGFKTYQQSGVAVGAGSDTKVRAVLPPSTKVRAVSPPSTGPYSGLSPEQVAELCDHGDNAACTYSGTKPYHQR